MNAARIIAIACFGFTIPATAAPTLVCHERAYEIPRDAGTTLTRTEIVQVGRLVHDSRWEEPLIFETVSSYELRGLSDGHPFQRMERAYVEHRSQESIPAHEKSWTVTTYGRYLFLVGHGRDGAWQSTCLAGGRMEYVLDSDRVIHDRYVYGYGAYEPWSAARYPICDNRNWKPLEKNGAGLPILDESSLHFVTFNPDGGEGAEGPLARSEALVLDCTFR